MILKCCAERLEYYLEMLSRKQSGSLGGLSAPWCACAPSSSVMENSAVLSKKPQAVGMLILIHPGTVILRKAVLQRWLVNVLM